MNTFQETSAAKNSNLFYVKKRYVLMANLNNSRFRKKQKKGIA